MTVTVTLKSDMTQIMHSPLQCTISPQSSHPSLWSGFMKISIPFWISSNRFPRLYNSSCPFVHHSWWLRLPFSGSIDINMPYFALLSSISAPWSQDPDIDMTWLRGNWVTRIWLGQAQAPPDLSCCVRNPHKELTQGSRQRADLGLTPTSPQDSHSARRWCYD